MGLSSRTPDPSARWIERGRFGMTPFVGAAPRRLSYVGRGDSRDRVQYFYLLMTKKSDLKRQVSEAIQACHDKKAEEVTIMELEQGSGAFTDYFVVCSGTNPRQIQAIADEVEDRLEKTGMRPAHTEGYKQAEWVLLDYVDFVVHVFSSGARSYYDLERLWRTAKKLEPAQVITKPRRRAPAKKAAVRKRA
jgi:ribosome-associated protein